MLDIAGARTESAGAPSRAGIAALHLAGFAATSALLERAVRWLPGFEASGLAERLAGAAAAEVAGGGGGGWIRLVLREAIIPAAVEELLFRGVVFAGLRRAAGPRAAILGSALLFGGAHGDLHHGLVAALLGISIGCLRERHGLALAFGAHALNNALAFSVPAGPLFFEMGAAMDLPFGLVLLLALAGSSNAVLLQALRSGDRGDPRRAAATSGDARG